MGTSKTTGGWAAWQNTPQEDRNQTQETRTISSISATVSRSDTRSSTTQATAGTSSNAQQEHAMMQGSLTGTVSHVTSLRLAAQRLSVSLAAEQETAFLVQIVLERRFLVFAFGVTGHGLPAILPRPRCRGKLESNNASALQTQTQGTAFLVQSALNMRFLVFDFGVYTANSNTRNRISGTKCTEMQLLVFDYAVYHSAWPTLRNSRQENTDAGCSLHQECVFGLDFGGVS
eukprot:3241325-Rhodomonas_salina.1